VQALDEKEKLLRMDDQKLKERATKFTEFLDANNEKATAAFCRLSKEGGLSDDQSAIRDDRGGAFGNGQERNEYIRKYYAQLYRKKLDQLLSIEEFLGGNGVNDNWVSTRKLSEEEKQTLEQQVDLRELTESLNDSNFHSTSGWDGVSFKVIRKYWGLLGPLMVKMTNETFTEGELSENFKLGLIKLIPKKGNARRVQDWRPITLLNCGYKIISGVVAKRL
jgi:hypothetical protein